MKIIFNFIDAVSFLNIVDVLKNEHSLGDKKAFTRINLIIREM
jgi:hypothetical protein